MRLVTFQHGYGKSRLGILDADAVLDINHAAAALLDHEGATSPEPLADALLPADIVGFLQGGDRSADLAQRTFNYARELDDQVHGRFVRIRLEDVELLPPVPRPPKVICVARNFAAHAEEAGRPLPEIPILFARFPSTLLAHGASIVRPVVSPELDWEGELAVVIGRGGGHISRAEAMSHVAGYSIFNDVTVRDYQFRTPQYVAGKNFRASGPFGPYLTTADEIDPSNLDLKTEVNGKTVQNANTADMIFDIPTIIEHVSEWIDLEPGDVIAMGTPSGVGFTRDPPWFLQPGDTVRVTISKLGTLENPVIAEETADT